MEEGIDIDALVEALNKRFTTINESLEKIREAINGQGKGIATLRDKVNSIIAVTNANSAAIAEIRGSLNAWEKPIDEDEGYIN